MKVEMADFSKHAKMRRKQMRITEDEIEAALADPESTYPGDPRYGPRTRCFQRGRIVVVADGSTVITVLWHRKEGRDGNQEEGG